jgi:hypothetical protein
MNDVTKALGTFVLVISTLAALAAGGALVAGVSAAVVPADPPATAPTACTADPLRLGYSVEYSASIAGDAVTGVIVTDTAAAPDLARCAGAGYQVTLRDAAGRSLATVQGTVPSAVTEVSSTGFAAPVPAVLVAQGTLTLSR